MITKVNASTLGKVMIGMLALLLGAVAAHARDLPDFSGLAAENSPAVVNISTRQLSSVRQHLPDGMEIPQFPEGNPLNELFKKFFEGQPDVMPDSDSRSLGSGFVISADGYILTNHHVVSEADEIIVRLSDRRVYEAEVIGTDKQSDVALLKIDANDLPVVRIGKSSQLKVGEWVLAIGSPFGFDHTVTAGIVSAKGRNLPSENYVPFIQTDVAINPGNSGGPLFNLDGEVIGVNSQIFSRTGGFMGLSFAIPIELATNVADQLKSKGRVSRGYIGVLIQDVDRNLAESFGLAIPKGALVARVLQDSPAAAAGIETGDIILEFEGQELLHSSQLPPLVGTTGVAEEVTLKVLRNGKEREIKIEIAELPGGDVAAANTNRSSKATTLSKSERLGLQVRDLGDGDLDKLGLTSGQGGVFVEAVRAGAARDAGVKSGDVILMLGGEHVKDANSLETVISKLSPGESVPVLVHRRQSPMFLALRAPDGE